jgi:AraC-like DNA-binding protein
MIDSSLFWTAVISPSLKTSSKDHESARSGSLFAASVSLSEYSMLQGYARPENYVAGVTSSVPPHRSLMRHRIDRAKELLPTRVLSVADIASFYGFADQSHFTRDRQRESGLLTPREWHIAEFPITDFLSSHARKAAASNPARLGAKLRASRAQCRPAPEIKNEKDSRSDFLPSIRNKHEVHGRFCFREK